MQEELAPTQQKVHVFHGDAPDVFAYLMEGSGAMSDKAIFEDTSNHIYEAMKKVATQSTDGKHFAAGGFRNALSVLGI